MSETWKKKNMADGDEDEEDDNDNDDDEDDDDDNEDEDDDDEIVIIDYSDLLEGPYKYRYDSNDGMNHDQDHDVNNDSEKSDPKCARRLRLLDALERAFGPNRLGLIGIRNVPGFVDAKAACLPLVHTLAHLPADYLEEHVTDPSSLYNAGWSHGKERLKSRVDDDEDEDDEKDGGGRTRQEKQRGRQRQQPGSFYFNPLTDIPGTAEDRERYPASYPLNVWPTEKLPRLEIESKRLGRILKSAVVHVARHIDALGTHRMGSSYPARFLHDTILHTEKVKGRLLYYFPLEEDQETQGDDHDDDDDDDDEDDDDEDDDDAAAIAAEEDSWIGWHNDSGFLTALAGEIYVDDETGEILPDSPDPHAGLHVLDQKGCVRGPVRLPPDCMAVQLGECVQIVTGGVLVATPHCVRAATATTRESRRRRSSRRRKVARISFPCFVDAPSDVPLRMPPHCHREDVLEAGAGSARVPPLAMRWTHDGMTFGDFLQRTFALYYDWNHRAAGNEGDDENENENQN